MDEVAFKAKRISRRRELDLSGHHGYWQGYMRGLSRARYGDALGTEAQHQ